MNTNRRGLTLVELLIVLVILAIMTTIAIQSTDMLVDQSRYDATRQTLQNIQNAILGPAGQVQPNGLPQITGFVADMGRLPIALPDPITGNPSLRELWDSSAFMLATQGYTNQSVTFPLGTSGATYTINLPCGWRGPYLRFPNGSNGRLVDGWGNPFNLLTTTTALGSQVNAVKSLGADGVADPTTLPPGYPPYNQDQYAPDQTYTAVSGSLVLSTPLNTFSAQALGLLPVQVKVLSTSGGVTSLIDPVSTDGTVTIVMVEPVNGALPTFASTGSAINYVTIPAGGSPPATGLSSTSTAIRRYDFSAPTTTVSCTFTQVSIGPRAIQAFQPSATPARKSAYTPIIMPSGGLPTMTLILQ
jgi:prepilin-type N-terminal cleavage/methylation domain-containing protein